MLTLIEQPDRDTCGPAALCTAASRHYDTDFDSATEVLNVRKWLLPDGTLPTDMIKAAASLYADLQPYRSARRGDAGVALTSNLKHWVAFERLSGKVKVYDPLGRVYATSWGAFLKGTAWGLVLREQDRCHGRQPGNYWDLLIDWKL
jgi:hypothetical protein